MTPDTRQSPATNGGDVPTTLRIYLSKGDPAWEAPKDPPAVAPKKAPAAATAGSEPTASKRKLTLTLINPDGQSAETLLVLSSDVDKELARLSKK